MTSERDFLHAKVSPCGAASLALANAAVESEA